MGRPNGSGCQPPPGRWRRRRYATRRGGSHRCAGRRGWRGVGGGADCRWRGRKSGLRGRGECGELTRRWACSSRRGCGEGSGGGKALRGFHLSLRGGRDTRRRRRGRGRCDDGDDPADHRVHGLIRCWLWNWSGCAVSPRTGAAAGKQQPQGEERESELRTGPMGQRTGPAPFLVCAGRGQEVSDQCCGPLCGYWRGLGGMRSVKPTCSASGPVSRSRLASKMSRHSSGSA